MTPAFDPRIYLDYNATAPCRDEVLAVMARTLRTLWGNASSSYAEGRAARAALETARDQVASALGASRSEITFTSGGTEADNWALRSAKPRSGQAHPQIVTTAIEHQAVLNTCAALEAQGWRITRAGCNPDGWVDPVTLAALIDEETTLVSVMQVNNETGVIQPVVEIAAAAHSAQALMHTDAVQGFGRLPLNVRTLGVDIASVSAHKIGGPKGVGALYIRHGLTLDPLISGGPQEHGLRAGTENVPAIAGFGLAAHLATAETAREQERLQGLKAMLWDGLRAGIQGIHLNGAWECSVAHTLSVSCEGVSGEAVMMALDLAGIAVSTGAACASGALEPSHVLEAMCCGRERCRGALRISMGYRTSTRDIEILLAHLPRVIARLRATS